MSLAGAFRHQHIQRLAHDLFGAIAEDTLRALVEKADVHVLTDGDHRLGRDIEDSGQSGLGRFQGFLGLFALCDVDADGSYSYDVTRFI